MSIGSDRRRLGTGLGDEAFRTLTHHLEDIGALHRQGREPCPGPLLVHLLNLAECHAPEACGLHYRWHPPTTWQRCWDSTRPLLIRCDDCEHPDLLATPSHGAGPEGPDRR